MRADLATRELTRTVLKLRDDLVFAPQQHGEETFYHIEVPSRGSFYRVGYAEYVFVSLLDGDTTFSQALTMAVRALGAECLSANDATSVYTWLLENRLGSLVDEDDGAMSSLEVHDSTSSFWGRLNPFWMKLPLGHPDRFLASAARFTAWIFSPWASLLGGVIMITAAVIVALDWQRFMATSETVFAPSNWLWLGASWVGLKLIHEFAHGIVCKKYGGDVRETGIVFILFAPMAYVDVTSSWRFTSRWQRIHVAVAGMYLELLTAAIAVLVWSHTESQYISHLLFNVIFMASASTLLFNANPLMRFDGYYVLSDLLGIPNLYTDGSLRSRELLAWLFFGVQPRKQQLGGFRHAVTTCYGVAASLWKLTISASLALGAAAMWHGAGLILAVVGIITWFGIPLWRLIGSLRERYFEERHTLVRAGLVGLSLGLVIYAVTMWLPWPARVTAPAVVEFAGEAFIRSRSAGFIDEVHVADGEMVEQGDLLLTFRNDDLLHQIQELEHSLEQALIRRRTALATGETATAQIEQANVEAFEQQLIEKRRQSGGERLVAPCRGQVVARNLGDRVDTFVEEGTDLLSLVRENEKELVVSLDQDDVDLAYRRSQQSVRFRIATGFVGNGTVKRVEPRASNELPHAAMSAVDGGSLAVSQRQSDGNLELVEPRFTAIISLPGELASRVRAGQRGYLTLGWSDRSIGEHIYQSISTWVDDRLCAQAQ